MTIKIKSIHGKVVLLNCLTGQYSDQYEVDHSNWVPVQFQKLLYEETMQTRRHCIDTGLIRKKNIHHIYDGSFLKLSDENQNYVPIFLDVNTGTWQEEKPANKKNLIVALDFIEAVDEIIDFTNPKTYHNKKTWQDVLARQSFNPKKEVEKTESEMALLFINSRRATLGIQFDGFCERYQLLEKIKKGEAQPIEYLTKFGE